MLANSSTEVNAWWEKYGRVALSGDPGEGEVTKTSRTKNGGWAPVFLQGYDWAMKSVPHAQESMPILIEAEKGAGLIVLRDDGSRVWYVRGLETPEKFFAAFHLEVAMPKGIGPLMKRLSRLLVEFRVAAWGRGENINVRYLNHGAVRSQAYDGSAKVSRAFVMRIAATRVAVEYQDEINILDYKLTNPLPTDDVVGMASDLETLRKRVAELEREALTIPEGEFTLLLGDGSGAAQPGFYKGQATVVEDADYDILLPSDSAKGEIRLTTEWFYFGIKPIAAHDHLFMDRQSLTNLNTTYKPGMGFFSHDPDRVGQDRLVRWMAEHMAAYKAKIDSGDFNSTLRRSIGHLEWESDVDKFLGFFLHRYVAMGGDVRWFRRTLSAAFKLGLESVERRYKGTAYPVPGLRLYVRPSSIANKHVRRGQIAWDLERGVVYVNDIDAVTYDPYWGSVRQLEQWLEKGHKLSELVPGVQANLGGQDNDDALYVVPFIDWDGQRRVLVWRSPNMPGERHVFEYLSGDVPETGDFWFHADSRRLAPFTTPTIDPNYAIRPFEGPAAKEYSLAAINATAKRMVESRAAVGMFCLMVREIILINRDLPASVAAFAEDVIDACSKTFDDVSGVIRWTQDVAQQITLSGAMVPELVYEEFCNFLPRKWVDEGQVPAKCSPMTHWIDILTAQAGEVIEAYKRDTRETANRATPPSELFERAMGWAQAGHGLRSAYGRTVWAGLQATGLIAREVSEPSGYDDDPDEFGDDLDGELVIDDRPADVKLAEVFENARLASMEFLEGFGQEQWGMVCVGGLADTYMAHIALRDGRGGLDEEPNDTADIRDNAFFQLGHKLQRGRERGIDEITLEGLVQIGILADLSWTPDYRLRLSMRTLTPLAAMKVVEIKHGWFNYGIARKLVAPNARMAGMDKTLVARLKAEFQNLDLTGKAFSPDMVKVQIGARQVEKPVLKSVATGKMLGIISGALDVRGLPSALRVVTAHTANDVTWLMMASD